MFSFNNIYIKTCNIFTYDKKHNKSADTTSGARQLFMLNSYATFNAEREGSMLYQHQVCNI